MKEGLTPGQWELISAALDGKLSPRKQSRFDLARQSDQALQTGLKEMAEVRVFLRSIPRRKAPRNFILKPDQVGSSNSSALTNFFRIVSVAAAVLMISLFAIEFMPGLLSPGMSSVPAGADEVMLESPLDLAPTSEPLIFWNGVTGAEKAYGMGGGSEQPVISIDPPSIEAPYPGDFSAEVEETGAELPAEEPVGETLEETASDEGKEIEEEMAPKSSPEQSEPGLEENTRENPEPVANPIIGIRPAEDWGQKIESQESAGSLQVETTRDGFPWLLVGEIGLGVLAMASATLAFLSYRRK